MALNLEAVERFAEIRNRSPHQTNLQFHIDLREAGIDPKELPKADPMPGGFSWDLGFCQMMEIDGKITY